MIIKTEAILFITTLKSGEEDCQVHLLCVLECNVYVEVELLPLHVPV